MSNIYFVGDSLTFSPRWFLNGTELTTGTAYAFVYRNNAGTVQFLETNGTTFSSPYNSGTHNHTLTHTANVGWLKTFTVPTGAANYNLAITGVHSSTAAIQKAVYTITDAPFNFIGFALNGVS